MTYIGRGLYESVRGHSTGQLSRRLSVPSLETINHVQITAQIVRDRTMWLLLHGFIVGLPPLVHPSAGQTQTFTQRFLLCTGPQIVIGNVSVVRTLSTVIMSRAMDDRFTLYAVRFLTRSSRAQVVIHLAIHVIVHAWSTEGLDSSRSAYWIMQYASTSPPA